MAPWLHTEAPGTLGKPMECLVLGPCIPPPSMVVKGKPLSLPCPCPWPLLSGWVLLVSAKLGVLRKVPP